MTDFADTFYDGVSQNTNEVLKKVQHYVDVALDLGDAVHLDKPDRVVIDIRIKKPGKGDKNGTASND